MSQEHQESQAPESAVQGKAVDLHPRLRIGFAGARNLCGCGDCGASEACALATTQRWLAQTLQEIWECSAAALPNHPLRLVCGMAHGADRIAIDSFLAWRGSGAHELLAVFPCPPEDFRDHSGVDDPSAFDRQHDIIRRDPARCGELVLDGVIAADALMDAEAGYAANCAHAYQSAILVRQCDVLVVVLDRRQPGKPGGTRTTIEEALSFEKPVLVVDQHSKSVFLLSQRDQLRPTFAPTEEFCVLWRSCLTAEVIPDGSAYPSPHAALGSESIRISHPSEVLLAVDKHFPEVDGSEVALMRGWNEFFARISAPSSIEDIEKERANIGFLAAVSGLLSVLPTVFGEKSTPAPQKNEDNIGFVPSFEDVVTKVSTRHSDAMAAYRGRFIRNYAFGLIAVLIAITAAFLIQYKHHVPFYPLMAVLLYLTLLKWLLVEDIATGTHSAKRARISETAVSLRYQIERYRAMEPLFFAGVAAMRLPRPSARRGQQLDVAEDLMRMVPIAEVSARHDKHIVLEKLCCLLSGQLRYHKQKSSALRVARHRLESAVEVCGKAILIILAFDVALIHAKMILKTPYFRLDPLAIAISDALTAVGFVLVLATAFLPALMATLNAILFQSAAEQLSQRHQSMSDSLQNLFTQACGLRELARTRNAPASINQDILGLAEKTAAAMAEEVAEWAALYLQSVKET